MSGFVRAICQIGIFMICAQAIVHFRPKASYEKYLKMLVSSMILIQLFLAVAGVFSAEGMAEMTERVVYFTESMNASMRQASENAFFSEEDMQFQLTGVKPGQGTEEEERAEITVQIAPIPPVEVEVRTGAEMATDEVNQVGAESVSGAE